MASLPLALHIAFIGIWLGCVLTEALFERALLGTGKSNKLILARLHKKVDLLIEIPAFVAVVSTGTWMLSNTPLDTLLGIKIGFGLIAVLANIICVHLVFARLKAAEAGNWTRFERLDHLQHKIGVLVEEEGDFDRGVFVAVGSMGAVGLDGFSKGTANRAFIGFLGIGRAHDLAIARDSVFAFKHLNHNRSGRHEFTEFAKERTFGMNGIEAFGLFFRHPDALGSDDAKAGLFQHLGDGAGQIAAGGVWFDNRESTCHGHDGLSSDESWGISGSLSAKR